MELDIIHPVVWLSALLVFSTPLISHGQSHPQPKTRVAVLESSWDQTEFSQTALQTLRTSLSNIETVMVMEPALVQTAARGFGYDGSLNLTVLQARDLGAAIGCDYYMLGRARLAPRSLGPDQIVYRAWLGLFIVDARSGKLAGFEFLEHEQAKAADASHSLLADLASNLSEYLDRSRRPRGEIGRPSSSLSPDVIEIDNPELPTQPNSVEPPRILISSKPTYTKAAQTADVTATVELKVTFLPDGTIGPIEVVRWAGFGLDESAINVARKLRFRPARLNGRPVAVRALVQYKFQLKTSVMGFLPSPVESATFAAHVQVKEKPVVESA